MKKRITSAVIALSLTVGGPSLALGAEYSPNVIINNDNIKLEQIHINEKEQMMFPIRVITEKLDYEVKWNNKDWSIELSKCKDLIKLRVDEAKINVNGKDINLDNAPMVKNGQTLIPTEFFEKALGLNLGWDSEENVLKINNPADKSEEYFEISEDEIVRKKIDNYMNSLTKYQNFQGSLLVAKNDKLIINKGYGLAYIGQSIKNQSQTKFALGSVTKQFTAMAIMQLNEKGLINLEDNVSKYVPGLSEGEKVTIDNLLTHTSGLTNYTDLPAFMESDFNNTDPMKMVDLIKDLPLEFAPGEIFKYSNTNYLLLGMIVEEITGESLEDYLEENILNPLDMKNTGVINGKNKVTPDATPYSGYIEVEEIDDKPVLSQSYGAGNMYSTVEDLYRWDRALKTDKLVSEESLNNIFKNHIIMSENAGYGYGFMIADTEDGKVVGHGGNTFGFSSNIDRYVDEDLTIIALSNKGYVDLGNVSENVKNISLKKEYEEPEKIEEIEIEDKEIYQKYIGEYDFINGATLTVSEKDGKLFAQATGQGAFEIYPQSETRFFAKIADIKIEFMDIEDKASKLVLEQLGQEFNCERIENEEDDNDKEEEKPLEPVEVDTEIYKDYEGEYELSPGAMATITNEDEKIYAQLTGQDKYEIFPLSESEYFYKVVDAKILFERDEEGNVMKLILDQNGVQMPGDKM